MSGSKRWNPIQGRARALVIGGWVATLVWLELRGTLRPVRDSKIRRDVRNLGIAALAGAVMQWVETPVAFHLAERAERNRNGLVQQAGLPRPVRGLAAVVLLDYTLYLWHVLTHRIPFLWRFHRVHHIDREMDAYTALRFHFGEIAISVIFRAAQVALIGPSPSAFAAWQMFLFLCILFHHSNVHLPLDLERRLARIFVTPRLHGIHHSVSPELANSNWSSGLTIWDWLHRTLRTQPPQDTIVIGVPGQTDDQSQTLGSVLTAPFREAAEVVSMPRTASRDSLSLLS